ncbi:GtrA family protein [Blastococcus sp. TML/M2B]|uniref:GtrA family protein n=1 Tax=unclassified Blastococcus TaxID=2619396 RepID=UPI00190AD9ED|nr:MULTISPECIES: GtrA family protein [unclassified Blastococcus]MBN1093838.1 GtrA family protein [Blastococcus sp. TML/M2B]MBN1096039.1 GtrA family protein [Blastococcus sp. TML/C7B]
MRSSSPSPEPSGSRLRRRLKELGAFGVVGGFAFVVDVGLFQLLYGYLDVGAVTSKTLATLVSMTVAFLGHRNWAFAHRDKTTIRRSFTLFTLINLGTLVLGAAIIWFVRYPLDQERLLIIQIANIGSIGLNSVVRYLAYRRWVFPAFAAVDPAGTGDPTPPADPALPTGTRGAA